MKRFLSILSAAILVSLVAYFLYSNSRPEITNFPSANRGVVAFGDSLVEGVGSTRGGGFVTMLSEDLNVPIVNLGVSGDTTAESLKRVDVVANRKPAVTILLIGGNDFLRGVSAAETRRNLEKIIEAIQMSGSVVILLGLESGIPGRNEEELFQALKEKYKTAYVADILDGIYGRQTLMSDSLHPNDRGYELMAERIKPILQKLIN